MNESPFAAILSGETKEQVIAENDFFIAVLETKPLVVGHVVVIAKQVKDDLFDLPAVELATLLVFAQPIAHAIRAAILCRKVGVAVLGLQTQHAHLHLVPIASADDLNFTRPKLTPTFAELKDALQNIRAALVKKN
jgi:histidine triad (HIT) family protein